MNSYPKVRVADIVVQEFADEVLIYDLQTNKAFCLNETSAIIWQKCDGKNNISEITEYISREVNSVISEDLVWLAIDQLKKENLLENANEIPNHFAGTSRREVIKKIGLKTMIALPIIASLVAPSSTEAAASFCNVGMNCTCAVNVGGGNSCAESGPVACIMFTSGIMSCVCVQMSPGNTMGNCTFV
jgi:hypothetical protein